MRLMLMLCLMLLPLVADSQSAPPQETPRQVVEKLVSASHGLNAMSGPEIPVLLERVRQNPAPYIPFLLRYLTSETILAARDLSAVQAAENAALVLAQAGGPTGRTELAQRLTSFNTAADQSQLQITRRQRQLGPARSRTAAAQSEFIRLRERTNRLITVKRTIINALAGVNDPVIKEVALQRLATEDYGTQLIYIRYLANVGKQDSRVKQRLQELLTNKRSPFHDSQMLKSVIESLDRQD